MEDNNIVNFSSHSLVDEKERHHSLRIPKSYKNTVHSDYSSSPSGLHSSSCSLQSSLEVQSKHSTASSGLSLHHSHPKSQFSFPSSDSNPSLYTSHSHMSSNKSDGVLSTASSAISLPQTQRVTEFEDAQPSEHMEHTEDEETSIKAKEELNIKFVSLVGNVTNYITRHQINIQQTIVPFLINPHIT